MSLVSFVITIIIIVIVTIRYILYKISERVLWNIMEYYIPRIKQRELLPMLYLTLK